MNISNSTPSDTTYVFDYSLKVLTQQTRTIFYCVFIVICIFTVLGNVCAISSVLKRKCKYLQKTCIVSLALSDILSALIFTINNLDSFKTEYMVWSLGNFACTFIPMGQIVGVTASSIAVLIIALDRYQNVIYALSKKWNPSLTQCVLTAVCLWLVCLVVAYPMGMYFDYYPITMVHVVDLYPVFEDAYMCVSTMKSQMAAYYTTMCILIFCPLFSVFLFFYYKIAALIWQHRKPVSSKYVREDHSENTKSTETSTKPEVKLKPILRKEKNIQVERKIRTFKIVVVLMIVFIAFRLPYLVLCILKLLYKFDESDDHLQTMWNINYSLIALNMLNCCLNPLLYTFLNETINVCRNVNEFVCKVFCCCFYNTQFEDTERGNYGERKLQVKIKEPEEAKNSNAAVRVVHIPMPTSSSTQSSLPKY